MSGGLMPIKNHAGHDVFYGAKSAWCVTCGGCDLTIACPGAPKPATPEPTSGRELMARIDAETVICPDCDREVEPGSWCSCPGGMRRAEKFDAMVRKASNSEPCDGGARKLRDHMNSERSLFAKYMQQGGAAAESQAASAAKLRAGATPEPREWQGYHGYEPISLAELTPATVTNTGVTQTKRCKQFEMMGFHVRRGMNEEACVFCGRSEQDLATAGEPMRTGAESVFTHEGKNPLDRALDDFTARRKAKRLNAMAPGKSEGERSVYRCKSCGRVSETYFDCQCERTGGYLSRAMSTPLPHDTEIHTRLMPWKGKEDGQ